jgi:hypothetical protein
MSTKLLNYQPLPYQAEFHLSRKPKVYLSAGYGGGKTYALIMKMFMLMNENYGLPGGLLVPNLKMFKRDVLPTVQQICEDNGIPFRFHRQDGCFLFPYTKSRIYIFHAEDHGASIRGPNLAFMLINEVTLISKAAFDAALARVRLKSAGLLQIAMSGTPEGFNWAYDYFISDPRNDTDVIFGDMRMNTHVADSYAQMLMDSYDELMVKQYVSGQFVNLNAQAALYNFRRQMHTSPDVEQVPGLPVWVSIDFNVNPMAATIWNRMPAGSKYTLQAFDEICISGADTYLLGKTIRERIGDEEEVVLFPDPAGKNRSVRGHLNDMEILEECGFEDIRYKSRILSIRECLNAANSFFGKNRAILNSKRCKETIKDYEQCVYKPGTSELLKKDFKRTHWLDGTKNMLEYEFPITIGAGGWREDKIR